MTEETLRRLTAYVDGELTTAECRAVEQLLHVSAEARQLLGDLQRDAEAIRAMPRVALPASFDQQVLARIWPTSRTSPAQPADRRRTYWHAAMAAALVLAIGLGTYYLLQDLAGGARPEGVVANNAGTPPTPESMREGDGVAPRPEGDGTAPAIAANRDSGPTAADLESALASWKALVRPLGDGVSQLVPETPTELASILERNLEPSAAQETPFSNPALLTAPPGSAVANPFKTLDLKLALFLDPKNLETVKLTDRLKQDSLHHVDFACLESWKAFERLQTACKVVGIKLVVDQDVSQRLAKKVPTMVMVYLENTTPDQVTKLVQALQAEDKKAEAKKKGEAQFESVMVQPLDEAGRKRLAESLGVSVSTLAPVPVSPNKNLPAGVDPSKPLSEETIKSLERLAAGHGTKTNGKEPIAVALAYLPNRNRAPVSKEVKLHLDSRRGWQPEAVHVVFILRPGRG